MWQNIKYSILIKILLPIAEIIVSKAELSQRQRNVENLEWWEYNNLGGNQFFSEEDDL